MKRIYNTKDRTKRYVLLFSKIDDKYQFREIPELVGWTEYDTLEEVREEVKLIKEMYDPKEVGWTVLDYAKNKFILSGYYGYLAKLSKRSNKDLYDLDKYFRGPDEIPENYKWDEGEYSGWLRFRWGDGKNAIDYKERPKKQKRNHEPMTFKELYEIFDDDWTDDYSIDPESEGHY